MSIPHTEVSQHHTHQIHLLYTTQYLCTLILRTAVHAPSASQTTFTAFRYPVTKTDRHRNKQTSTQETRAVLVMIIDRPSLLDVAHAPQVQGHAVEERDYRHNGESPSRRQRYVVAEVEKRGCDRPEDDGEF